MKKILLLLISMLFVLTVNANTVRPVKVTILLNEVITAVGEGGKVTPWSRKKTFQLIGWTSAGAGATTVGVQVSNDGTNWVEVDELALTLGTSVTSDTYEQDSTWKYVRGDVKTISGTDGTVTLFMGAHQ